MLFIWIKLPVLPAAAFWVFAPFGRGKVKNYLLSGKIQALSKFAEKFLQMLRASSSCWIFHWFVFPASGRHSSTLFPDSPVAAAILRIRGLETNFTIVSSLPTENWQNWDRILTVAAIGMWYSKKWNTGRIGGVYNFNSTAATDIPL